jgi:hypothetical protein
MLSMLLLLAWLGAEIMPPPMPVRQISPSTQPVPGEEVRIVNRGDNFTLYLPPGWETHPTAGTVLTVHFHGAAWFAIQEHRRRGIYEPLLCFSPGEGSRIYGKAFEDEGRFGELLGEIERELAGRLGRQTTLEAVNITSFSAGYGAVREIVKSPKYVARLRRVILADSMYAGYDPASTQPGATSRPLDPHIDMWAALARRAMDGEMTFVVTYSMVPTAPRYASSSDCARAVVEKVGLQPARVEPGSIPAASDPDYPLIERSGRGGFHAWGYGGTDAGAHMTHPRHIADIWKACDAAGLP